jgi:hypothetical protein
MAKNIHVVPNGDQWAVKREGDAAPVSTHSSQNEAERAGRQLARAAKVEFELHGRDGRIRERDSYGNDPRDSRG